jgi:probable HAF family extracellular repeat protein
MCCGRRERRRDGTLRSVRSRHTIRPQRRFHEESDRAVRSRRRGVDGWRGLDAQPQASQRGNRTPYAIVNLSSLGGTSSRGNSLNNLGLALGMNNRGQVVGTSCPAAGACHAFVWEKEVMRDLNTFRGPGYTDHLARAQDINDLGMITGSAVDPATGEIRTFLATPRHETRANRWRQPTAPQRSRSSFQTIWRRGRYTRSLRVARGPRRRLATTDREALCVLRHEQGEHELFSRKGIVLGVTSDARRVFC